MQHHQALSLWLVPCGFVHCECGYSVPGPGPGISCCLLFSQSTNESSAASESQPNESCRVWTPDLELGCSVCVRGDNKLGSEWTGCTDVGDGNVIQLFPLSCVFKNVHRRGWVSVLMVQNTNRLLLCTECHPGSFCTMMNGAMVLKPPHVGS